MSLRLTNYLNLLKSQYISKFMRILHLIPYIHPRYGGPSKAVIDMCKVQKQMGINVEIATTHFHNESPHLVEELKIHSFQSHIGEFKYSASLKKWLSYNIKRYDLVHIHTIFAYSTLIGSKICRDNEVPYIIVTTGQLYKYCLNNGSKLRKKIWWNLFDKTCLEKSSAIHFTTFEEMKRMDVNLNNKKRYVLPIGIDYNEQNTIEISDILNKNYFLFLGRINPIKGLNILLPAVSKILTNNNYHLVIAGKGDPDYIKSLKNKIRKLGISNKVIFVGHVSGSRKYTLLKFAKALVLPSHSENFGIVVIEAMSVGTPVLISNKVGIYDDIIKAKAGMVFNLRSDEIKFCADKIINNSEFAKKISKNASKLVKEKYNWPKITKTQIEIYEKIINTQK